MKQTATVLTHILTRVAENNPALSFLRTDFAVGGNKGGRYIKELGRWVADEESAEARKKLDAVLLSFRSGDLNCLVSTQVLEEGMDVKRCNLVVRFDRIQTLRSYVQVGF